MRPQEWKGTRYVPLPAEALQTKLGHIESLMGAVGRQLPQYSAHEGAKFKTTVVARIRTGPTSTLFKDGILSFSLRSPWLLGCNDGRDVFL